MNDLFQLLFKLLFPTSWLLKVPDEARISRRFRWRSTHQQPCDVTRLMAGHQCRGAGPRFRQHRALCTAGGVSVGARCSQSAQGSPLDSLLPVSCTQAHKCSFLSSSPSDTAGSEHTRQCSSEPSAQHLQHVLLSASCALRGFRKEKSNQQSPP